MSMPSLAQRYARAIEKNDLGLRARLGAELEAEYTAETERLTAPGALKAAALWYARQGIAVFPCEVRGKQPITAHGFKDASTDLAVVGSWWTYTPQANIGAATGLLFDVIDIDGPDGIASTFGQNMPLPTPIGKALTSRTAGLHLFVPPTGRGNGASIFPSVDYRGAGGYVILPPSIGANGVRYRWTQPLEIAA